MKMYPQLTRAYIRDGVSYANLVMLQNAIPPYRKSDSHQSPKTDQPPRHIDDILM